MKKSFIFVLVTLLVAALFVACDNDVKVDSATAYSQVLESEGAFVVNGKGYESLQDAILAVDAKIPGPSEEPVVISLTKDYKGHGAVVDADSKIILDLGGHTLTFTDVEDYAIIVKNNYFKLTNGTVTLFGDVDDVILLKAQESSFVEFADVNFSGAVYSVNSLLNVGCDLPDVRMEDSWLYVNDKGHVVLTELVEENEFVAVYGDSSITNKSGKDIEVTNGLYSIARSEVRSYYGTLQEALDSLDADDLTIVLNGNDESTEAVKGTQGKKITIKLSGNDIKASSITADADLEIYNDNTTPDNSATVDGSIAADGFNVTIAGNSTNILTVSGTVTCVELDAEHVIFESSITATSKVDIESCSVGNSVEDDNVYAPKIIIAGSYVKVNSLKGSESAAATSVSVANSYGSIGSIVASKGDQDAAIYLSSPTSDDSESLHLIVGDLDAGAGGIVLIGHKYNTTVDYVKVTGSVTCGGFFATIAELNASITATESVFITYSTVGGSDDSYNICSPNVTIVSSSLEVNAIKGIEDAKAKSVIVSDSYGSIGSIVASKGEETASTVITLTAPTSNDEEITHLTVGSMDAGTDNISLLGHRHEVSQSTYTDYVKVAGAVKCASLEANYAWFTSDSSVEASVVEAIANTDGYFAGCFTLKGSGESTISSGIFDAFVYEGSGTLNISGNANFGSANFKGSGNVNIAGGSFGYGEYFYSGATFSGSGATSITGGIFGDARFTGSGSVIINETTSELVFHGISALTDKVDIKSAAIYEDDFINVVKIVNRINQDADGQEVVITYKPEGLVFLNELYSGVIDMTSENIYSSSSAALVFDMSFYSDPTNRISRGLIVGEKGTAAASATFNFDNGIGKNELVVSGKIGLYYGNDNIIYSTQVHNNLIYRCESDVVDDVTRYFITDYTVSASPSWPGYYEYSSYGN